MNITEVRVKLVGEETERLRAFCSVTIDDAFVIRDLKIIEGDDGPFVAMPSRKMCDHCPKCGEKNHLRARFCNDCGAKLQANRAPRDESGRIKLYADVAHPINVDSREQIQAAVLEAYHEEHSHSLEPGYAPSDADYESYDDESTGFDDLIAELRRPRNEPDDERRQERAVEEPPTSSGASDITTSEIDTRPVETSGDDDDFAAGLDWSNATPDGERGGAGKARSGRNGRDQRPRQRAMHDASENQPTESVPTAEEQNDRSLSPPATSSANDEGASDDFGAGIF